MKYSGNASRFLAYLPITVLPILLPYFGSSVLGLFPTALSLLVAAYSATSVAARLLLIPVADRLGPRRVFLLGLSFFVCGDLAFALSPGFAGLLAGRVLLACAVAGVSVASLGPMAGQTLGAGQSLGGLNRAAGLGGLLGVLLCFAAMRNASLIQGWQRYFHLCALAGAAALLAAFFGWHPPASPPQSTGHPGMTALQRRLARLNACTNLCAALLATPLVLYPVQRFQSGLPAIAAAFLAPLVLVSLMQPTLGRLHDRQGSRRSVSLSLLPGGLAIALSPFAPALSLFAAAYMLFQLSAASVQIGLDASFLATLPAGQWGALTARYTACANLGGAVGAVVGGLLFQYCGLASPFWGCAGGFLLLLPFWRRAKAG